MNQPLQLRRRGAWLITDANRWQMANVEGPLEMQSPEREYFRVETSCKEVLMVSRPRGERGMRELRLDEISKSA